MSANGPTSPVHVFAAPSLSASEPGCTREGTSFVVITDIGCDADDLLAVNLLMKALIQQGEPARVAFVTTMFRPQDKAAFLAHVLGHPELRSPLLETQVFHAPGFQNSEDVCAMLPTFPAKFTPVYDQLQDIRDPADLDAARACIKPVSRLAPDFTDLCADHSVHLLVLSPATPIAFLDFTKINKNTIHMMGGVAKRHGETKIGYNIGCAPSAFVEMCSRSEDRVTLVTPVLCDKVRAAVNFGAVKQELQLSSLGDLVFGNLMRWHAYITKNETNFLKVDTPGLSDMVTTSVFLQSVFPDFFDTTLLALIHPLPQGFARRVLRNFLTEVGAAMSTHTSETFHIKENCTTCYLASGTDLFAAPETASSPATFRAVPDHLLHTDALALFGEALLLSLGGAPPKPPADSGALEIEI